MRDFTWAALFAAVAMPGHGFEASRESPLLFQVEEDIGERVDRSAEEPDVVRTLLDSLAACERSLEEETLFRAA